MRTLILSLTVIASATIYPQSATFQRGELVRVMPATAPPELKTYFVMGEQRITQNISEYWGQHFGGQLERAPQ